MALATTSSITQAIPTAEPAEALQVDERGDVKMVGNKVAVITGIVLMNGLADCFGRNGLNIAQAWAEDLYSRWFFANHPGTEVLIDTFVSTVSITQEYCVTVDALFTFDSFRDAQAFASFATQFVTGSLKRDENHPPSDWPTGVFISGIDLPSDHPYFGNATAVDSTTSSVDNGAGNLEERDVLNQCLNICPRIELSTRMTNVCLDDSFPSTNKFTCIGR